MNKYTEMNKIKYKINYSKMNQYAENRPSNKTE